MTVRMLMQFAGVGLLGVIAGYLICLCDHRKWAKRKDMQIELLREQVHKAHAARWADEVVIAGATHRGQQIGRNR